MEFRLKNINRSEPVYLNTCVVHNEMFFELNHNGRTYSSLFDDILYWYNKVERKLTYEQIKMICDSSYHILRRGIMLNTSLQGYNFTFANDIYHYGDKFRDRLNYPIYIREPEDPSNILHIETIKEVIKYVDREVIKEIVQKEIEYVDREVIKEVVKKEIEIIGYDDLPDCCICMDSKAYISFGCCSIQHCLKCAMRICNNNGKCSQCRSKVKLSNMNHVVFK